MTRGTRTSHRGSLFPFLGRKVDPSRQRVVKFLPSNPPRRGERVLVDGFPCRVVHCSVKWREPEVWTIKSLRVKREPVTSG